MKEIYKVFLLFIYYIVGRYNLIVLRFNDFFRSINCNGFNFNL